MSQWLNTYNFLPPIDQYSINLTDLPNGPGQGLDPYLPQYTLTTGDLQPLLASGGISGTPTNINGTAQTGSTGGLGGDPPPATPFMMFAYSQVTNIENTPNKSGVIQMVLLKANSQTLESIATNISDNPLTNDTYYFAPFNDIIDENAMVQVYYNIDTSVSPQTIRFYDAELVKNNSGNDISNYMLFAVSEGDYAGNSNTFAFWPVNNNYVNSGQDTGSPNLMNIEFQFSEFINQTNTSETHLKSGKFYHPYASKMTYNTDITEKSGYTEYGNTGSYKYFSGYGPGYPVNINYISSVITSQSVPVILNGNDNRINQFNQEWPITTNLSVYNFDFNKASNFADTYKFSTIIDKLGDNGVLYNTNTTRGCSNNNECNDTTDSFFANNFNTIQAGIAQYMTYQFIPFQHIKPPSTNIVTNYTAIPEYNYITIPQGIDFTPSVIGPSGVTGSYPMEIVQLIDTTGSTGVALPSLISEWMTNPTKTEIQCYNAVSTFSYCGFIDYYDSLNGIAYQYGECGATGLENNSFQKGACPGNQVCVPNFIYSQNRNPYIEPLYICVDKSVGVTTQNLTYYVEGIPNSGSGGYDVTYPVYDATPATNPSPNFANAKKTDKSENSIFLWIGIAVAVILVLIVLFVLINAFKPKASSYENLKLYKRENNL
jgi:hypothetical protein